MSSCNALPQMWAISPTRTMGWAFKRSCNGAGGALQEICGPIAATTGKDACPDSVIVLGEVSGTLAFAGTAPPGRRL